MNRDQLLASLLASQEDVKGIADFGDSSYIDWSCPVNYDDPSAGRSFEFGNGDGETIGMDMSWDRIERLQRALTLLLLERTDEDADEA